MICPGLGTPESSDGSPRMGNAVTAPSDPAGVAALVTPPMNKPAPAVTATTRALAASRVENLVLSTRVARTTVRTRMSVVAELLMNSQPLCCACCWAITG